MTVKRPLWLKGRTAAMEFSVSDTELATQVWACGMMSVYDRLVARFKEECSARGYEPIGKPVIEKQQDLFNRCLDVRVCGFVRKK